jgi:hypothetical protein
MSKNDGPNWAEIKTEYIYKGTSLRKLAEKHGVPFSTAAKRARREKWEQQRTQVDTEVDTAVLAVVTEAAVDRATRLINITNTLTEKLEARVANMSDNDSTKAYKDLLAAVKTLIEIQTMQQGDEDSSGDILRVEGFNSEWQE